MRRLIDRCAGIDVGQALLVVCVRVVAGSRWVEEVRSVRGNNPGPAGVAGLAGQALEITVCVSASYWSWGKAVDADTDSHEREPPDSQDDGCDRLELSGI